MHEFSTILWTTSRLYDNDPYDSIIIHNLVYAATATNLQLKVMQGWLGGDLRMTWGSAGATLVGGEVAWASRQLWSRADLLHPQVHVVEQANCGTVAERQERPPKKRPPASPTWNGGCQSRIPRKGIKGLPPHIPQQVTSPGNFATGIAAQESVISTRQGLTFRSPDLCKHCVSNSGPVLESYSQVSSPDTPTKVEL